MLFNHLLLPAFSVATLPHSFGLSRRDHDKFQSLLKTFREEQLAVIAPTPLNKCDPTLQQILEHGGEACRRDGSLQEKFFQEYFRDLWGKGASEEEIVRDIEVRGSCMYLTVMAAIQEAQYECRNYFCDEGSSERQAVEDQYKKGMEVAWRRCPELMDEWKDALEKGFVGTTTRSYDVVVTFDGIETLLPTSTVSVITQRPFTLPPKAWAFTTAYERESKTEPKPEETSNSNKPEETGKSNKPAETQTGGSNKPEETESSSKPAETGNSNKPDETGTLNKPEETGTSNKREESEDGDEPRSAAPRSLAESGLFGFAIFASIALSVVGF